MSDKDDEKSDNANQEKESDDGSSEKEEEKEGEKEEEEEEKEGEKEEEKGEDNEGPQKEVGVKRYGRMYSDEKFGEEYDGEGQYYPLPPPPDLDLLLGQTESKLGVKQQGDTRAEPHVELEEYLSEEAPESGGEGEEERLSFEEDLKDEIKHEKIESSPKPSLASTTSSEYAMRIAEYFMKPMEKTASEIQFESDYREIIEEKMKKIMRAVETEEEKKPVYERKPVEKKKLLLTEYDVSGLYPQPKVVESEVSFAFDEDEEAEKGSRGIQTDAEVIMELLRRDLKLDTESIFAKNAKDMIQKVRQVIEEIVTIVRRGISMDIPQKVNESLPHFKTNLKSNLITHLKEHLETPAGQDEEEEGGKLIQPVAELITQRAKRKPRKSFKKIEETVIEEPEEEEEAEEEGKLEEVITAQPKEKFVEEIAIFQPEVVKKREFLEEEEEIMPYEKIDWDQFLTDSEKALSIDPALRSEMELYIKERKIEIEKDMRLLVEKQDRKLKYKRAKDPQEIIKNLNLVVTMKFLLNTGDTYTSAFRYFMTFKEIKQDLAAIFKVPYGVLIIYRDEENAKMEIQDYQTALDLVPEIEPFDTVTFRLVTVDNDRWPLKSDHLDLPVPDIITCTVETGKDHRGVSEYKEVVVEIENRKIKKPFVGGYVDCKTGIEYHNAFSQSSPHPPKLPWDKRASRDTQTVTTRNKLINTVCHKSTQMARRDHYIPTDDDKIVTAKPYVDYEHWNNKSELEVKITTIQRYLRAMILRKFLKKMSEEYRRRKCWEIEQEKKRVLERENRIKLNIINMTYPKTKADFDMLYALVEKWRKAQVERISKLKTEAPRKAELCAVLEKEIKLLEAIEVHRIAVVKEQKRTKALRFMQKVAEPITWTGYRGMTIKMDSLKTQRARELKELYQSLARHDLGYQDRLELLISVKHALRIHCTRLTEELTGLINQECEMLIRGVKAKDLVYLRQRIELLFQEYFKDPIFNPEAAKYDPTFYKDPLRSNIFCTSCRQMKSLKNFSATSRDATVKICSSCQWLHNIALPRVDLSPFRYILKMVRRDEQKRNCYSSCAFILQDEDMRFLVENIWKGRSAVSEYDNLLDLRMPRWDKNKDWTPWNCILLTELEAKAHLKTDPAINYEAQLIGEIITKHELAKRHFQQLFATATRIRDTGKWANTVDVKTYEPLPLTADLWDIKPEECLKLKKTGNLYEVHETRRKDEGYVQYI